MVLVWHPSSFKPFPSISNCWGVQVATAMVIFVANCSFEMISGCIVWGFWAFLSVRSYCHHDLNLLVIRDFVSTEQPITTKCEFKVLNISLCFWIGLNLLRDCGFFMVILHDQFMDQDHEKERALEVKFKKQNKKIKYETMSRVVRETSWLLCSK